MKIGEDENSSPTSTIDEQRDKLVRVCSWSDRRDSCHPKNMSNAKPTDDEDVCHTMPSVKELAKQFSSNVSTTTILYYTVYYLNKNYHTYFSSFVCSGFIILTYIRTFSLGLRMLYNLYCYITRPENSTNLYLNPQKLIESSNIFIVIVFVFTRD